MEVESSSFSVATNANASSSSGATLASTTLTQSITISLARGEPLLITNDAPSAPWIETSKDGKRGGSVQDNNSGDADAVSSVRLLPATDLAKDKDDNVPNNSSNVSASLGGVLANSNNNNMPGPLPPGLNMTLSRVAIPQAVFEKIRERITYSHEREKQSLAKQILRKEEERRKLARERDADDLDNKIRVLKENISAEKAKRQRLYESVKRKMATEEMVKKQRQLDRIQQVGQSYALAGQNNLMGRDRAGSAAGSMSLIAGTGRPTPAPGQDHQHPYPNAHMLISQTNPLMRPRLMGYPMSVPVGAVQMPSLNQTISQSGPHHLELPIPNSGVGHKRQRSVSPSADSQQRLHEQRHNASHGVSSSRSMGGQSQQTHPSGKATSQSRSMMLVDSPTGPAHSPQPPPPQHHSRGQDRQTPASASSRVLPCSSSSQASVSSSHKVPSSMSMVTSAGMPVPMPLPMPMHAGPYASPVLCLVPNMHGGGMNMVAVPGMGGMPMGMIQQQHKQNPDSGPGQAQGQGQGHAGQPQPLQINSLTPQQQQHLIAQQMHALNALNQTNPGGRLTETITDRASRSAHLAQLSPKYARALHQAMAESQQRERSGSMTDIYRHYATAGLLHPGALIRAQPQPSASPHHRPPSQQGQGQGPETATSPHQRMPLGGIMTGIPVFGPGSGSGSGSASGSSSSNTAPPGSASSSQR